MKPVLYEPGETEFRTNGLGILNDAMSCVVTEELNGLYELQMTYPVDGIHYQDIAQRSIILAAPDPVRDPQPFRVYKIKKPMNKIVTIHARHIAYDLSGITVPPFQTDALATTLETISAIAIPDCPFTFWTDKSVSSPFAARVPESAWKLLGGVAGSILDVYGGEWEFDRFKVRLLNRRGADRGVTVRYGKNLTSLEQDENCSRCYTGVFPYWTNGEDVVVLPEQTLNADGNFSYSRIMPLDLSQYWPDKPAEEQLRSRAIKYMSDAKIGKPKVSLSFDFAQLDQTEEYKGKALLERVLIGDRVSVYFPDLGVESTARVVRIQYDALRDRYIKVHIGSVKSSLAETVASHEKQIEKIPTMTELQRAAEAATEWLTNGKGYKVERRDPNGNVVDTLYLDRPDLETAVNVLRVGQSGIGFSRTGVAGPYTSAWTLDGAFNADCITSGTVNAGLIKAGILRSKDGKFSLNLDTGEILISGYPTSSDLEAWKAAGVDKIVTPLYGYSLTDDGMRIGKAGEEIINLIKHTGMYVMRSSETMLKADASGVEATDVWVRNFLVAADHERTEKFTDEFGRECAGHYWV